MSKTKTVKVHRVERFAVFHSDDECLGVYTTLEAATEAATKELEEIAPEPETLTVCALFPKRLIRQASVAVEDL